MNTSTKLALFRCKNKLSALKNHLKHASLHCWSENLLNVRTPVNGTWQQMCRVTLQSWEVKLDKWYKQMTADKVLLLKISLCQALQFWHWYYDWWIHNIWIFPRDLQGSLLTKPDIRLMTGFRRYPFPCFNKESKENIVNIHLYIDGKIEEAYVI